MATATLEPKTRTLQDPELKEQLQRLRRLDDGRNIAAVVKTWLYLAAIIAGAVAFNEWRSAAGLHWAASLPVLALAVVAVGAGQHQLVALGHEASHHVLLRNRKANELVSDWFCMYPMFTTTHHYRLQHLAHHQFVNDPERDPNFAQLQANGHWKEFPMTSSEFWRQLFAQLLPWNMVNYLRATAVYNSVGSDKNPYQKHNGLANRIAKVAGIVYMFTLLAVLIVLVRRGYQGPTVLGVAGGMWAATMAFYALIPARWYHASRIHPTLSMRAITLMRVTFISVAFTAVALLSIRFGGRAFYYAMGLWILPIFTSFSFFMMMRQLVQHSNADRGWLTNTRVFLVNRFFRDSVLPYGQDYHLPHHLFATIPHYNLRELHELLLAYPEYKEQALEVHGVVVPKEDHHYPTVVEMLGPDYAPEVRHAAHVDNSVLDNVEVEEADAILAAARASEQE